MREWNKKMKKRIPVLAIMHLRIRARYIPPRYITRARIIPIAAGWILARSVYNRQLRPSIILATCARTRGFARGDTMRCVCVCAANRASLSLRGSLYFFLGPFSFGAGCGFEEFDRFAWALVLYT